MAATTPPPDQLAQLGGRLEEVIARLETYAADVSKRMDATDARVHDFGANFENLKARLEGFAGVLTKHAQDKDDRMTLLEQVAKETSHRNARAAEVRG